jgi:hypothetical protein
VRPNALEQVFVGRRGGRVELRLVLVDPADGRTRATQLAPTSDEREAARWLGRHLARGGEIRDLRRLRVRTERAGQLADAPGLARELVAAFDAERARDAADERHAAVDGRGTR